MVFWESFLFKNWRCCVFMLMGKFDDIGMAWGSYRNKLTNKQRGLGLVPKGMDLTPGRHIGCSRRTIERNSAI